MRYLVLVFLLSGCMQWQKPGATQAEFDVDKNACLAGSTTIVPGVPVALPPRRDCYSGVECFAQGSERRALIKAAGPQIVTNDALFNACMNARGYRLVK